MKKIVSIAVSFIMMFSMFQSVYASENVGKGTGLYDEYGLLNEVGLLNENEDVEFQTDEDDEKYNQFQTNIDDIIKGDDVVEEEDVDVKGLYDKYIAKDFEYGVSENISAFSAGRASISYYSGTSIPTYTSVTGRSLYTSTSNSGYSYYYYKYVLDEYFDYVYYLRDNCGWTVYKTTTSSDNSYGTVYMTKGSLLIAIIADFSTSKTVIMFETPTTSVSPTSVTLNASSRTMIVGNIFTLKATVKPSNASNSTVTWSSSNTSVASVNSSGVVTANKAGTATVTAKTSNGKTATCSITVKALNLEYYPNTNTQIPTFTCITGKNLYNKTVSDGLAMYQYTLDTESHTDYENYLVNKAGWSIYDEKTAEDYSYFMATYEKDDDVVIVMADFTNSKTVIAFEETVSVTGISLNKTSATLNIGETETLTATITPSNASNKNITWTSSNTTVATVSNGVVTAKSAGNTVITAKSATGNKTATCTITVNKKAVAVTGITLNKAAATLDVGEKETLTATITPSNASNKNITWTSSNTTVATVSNGVVTAKSAGNAIITVTTADGNYTAECEVAVVKPVPKVKVMNVVGKAGKTVDVTLKVENNPGIAVLGFNIGYDSDAMTLQAITVNDVFSSADVTDGPIDQNPYTFSAMNASKNITASGNLITATFLIKDNCAEGEYAITITSIEAYTLDEEQITFTGINGNVVVKDVTPGDITDDGNVNRQDLLRLGKYLAGWAVEINSTAADVTGDGSVNRQDLLRLGKYLAGWNVELK